MRAAHFAGARYFCGRARLRPSEGETLSPAELAASRWPCWSRRRTAAAMWDSFFARCGVQLSPQIELGAHGLLPDFAAIGFGLACVVQEFCGKELADGTVFPVRLRPAIPPRAVGACWLCAMELSGAAKEFFAPSGGRCAPCAADVTHFTLRQVCRSHRAIGLDSALARHCESRGERGGAAQRKQSIAWAGAMNNIRNRAQR